MSSIEIIDQPNKGKTGERLKILLENNRASQFENFYILSAYVKSSGVERLRDSIQQFKATGAKVFAVVGIGQKNTSIQGLLSLHSMCDEARIYHNESRTSTFHPKVYVFEKPGEKAVVFVGSSNLTGGGLFTNYESVFYTEYDLKNPQDAEKFDEVRGMINFYSTESEFCKTLTPELITEITEDYLSDEAKQTPEEREEGELIPAEPVKERVFGTKTIRPPPLLKLPIRRQQALPPTPPLTVQPTGTKGVLLWVRRSLPASSVQVVTKTNTNPTGGLRLVQADWRVRGSLIDDTTYFRNVVFGNFRWSVIKQKPYVEATNVLFDVTIIGKNIGLHRLQVRHKPSGEADQGNYTTSISWGALSDIIRASKLTGKELSLYAPIKGQNEPFYIEIK